MEIAPVNDTCSLREIVTPKAEASVTNPKGTEPLVVNPLG